MYPGIEVENPRYVLRIDNLKIQDVIEPVLTESVPMLRRDGQRIFLAAQKAIEFEFHFHGLAGGNGRGDKIFIHLHETAPVVEARPLAAYDSLAAGGGR